MTPSRVRAVAGSTVLVAGGLAVAQVLGYALQLVGARALGRDAYGAFAALLGVVLIGNVLALGLQAVGARTLVRRAAESPEDIGGAGRTVLRAGLVGGAAVAVATAVVSPAVMALLNLDGVVPVLLVAVSLVPLTVTGAQLGVAQGRESFARVGLLYVATGLGKSGGGIVGALATGSLLGALVGFALGAAVGAAAGAVVVRPLAARRPVPLPGLRAETLHATHALLALFVLTNVDVLLARALLSPAEAGRYAVGAIVAKIAFWLPQFVVVIAFPRMADSRRVAATLAAAGITAGLGVLVTLGAWLFGDLVVRIVGGAQYAGLGPVVWLFAAAGSAFALAQLLLMSRLAVDDRRAVLAVWAATVLLVGVAVLVAPRTVTGLVLSALTAGFALAAAGLVVALRERRT
ncbi:MAG: hypothetical protein R2737_11375 [Candidatus Nanopelagicales bacterium]